MGRPLHNSSPQKLSLLGQARVHYQNAQQRLWDANFKHSPLDETIVSNNSCKNHQRSTSSSSESSTTSYRSSVSSVTDSVCSQRSPSPMHSPASSVCASSSSFKNVGEPFDPPKPRPLLVKKKASFHLTLPTVVSSESIGANSSQDASQTSHFDSQASSDYAGSHSANSTITDNDTYDTEHSSRLSQSHARYHKHFSSLSTQLTYHITVLDTLISNLRKPLPSPPRTIPEPVQKARRGKRSTSFNDYSVLFTDDVVTEQEKRAALRQARIAELKRRGEEWQAGKRFDGSRYEKLCEGALSELYN